MKYKTYKLKEVGKVITGKTPPTKIKEYYAELGASFYTPSDYKDNYKYLENTARKVSHKSLQEFDNYIIPTKSIMVTCIGSDMGKVVLNKDEGITNQQINSLIVDEKEFSTDYIYYALKRLYPQLRKLGEGAGSTMPIINKTNFSNITLNIPPLPEQKRIANILSSFDNKIELLREQNKTLENIAQTIFKQWFIDFNFPDSNNKPYKDNSGKMIDSELGMIPEDWEVGKLGDYIEFTNGYAFKSIDYLEKPTKKSFKVFKMGNIKKGGGLSSTTRQDYVDGDNFDHLSKYVLKKGDLLMSMTDMKDKVSLLGHTALINKTGEFIVNQRVGLIRPKDKNFINYPYLYILTNNDPFLSRLRNKANSGVQVNLSTNSIKEILLIIPNTQLLQDFDYIAKNLFEKIFNNEYNIDNLKPIKAALLNKLIST